MRYPGAEKLEIIRLVEQSHLPVRRTLATLGILPGTFYRWYDRFQTGGPEALEDRSSRPRRVWNLIPDDVGYDDPAFFRRLFKRKAGLTPVAYRRKFTKILEIGKS